MAVESSQNANGLKTAWDTIVAPKAAFESIRNAPTWGWAFLISIVLFALGSYLALPATTHALTASWPNMVAQNPRLAGLSSADQQAQLQIVLKFAGFTWIFVIVAVPLFILISTVLYLIFDKIGRGDGTFGKYWAAACNISVVAGLGSVLTGIITIARGADSFLKPIDVQGAMSLGLLAPQAGVKLGTLLASITPITIWVLALGIMALGIVGRVPRVPAWLGGIASFLVPVLVGVAFAR